MYVGDAVREATAHNVNLAVFTNSSLQAVSVSLPTWSANVGYEEGQDWVVSKMQTGYPRSVMPGGDRMIPKLSN